jgi:hypothetical protein
MTEERKSSRLSVALPTSKEGMAVQNIFSRKSSVSHVKVRKSAYARLGWTIGY